MEEYDDKIENTGGAVFLAVCRGKVRFRGEGKETQEVMKIVHARLRAWRGMAAFFLVVRVDTYQTPTRKAMLASPGCFSLLFQPQSRLLFSWNGLSTVDLRAF